MSRSTVVGVAIPVSTTTVWTSGTEPQTSGRRTGYTCPSGESNPEQSDLESDTSANWVRGA